MTEHVTRKLTKWPFLVGDLCLLGLGGFIVFYSEWPLGLWQMAMAFLAVATGAWISVIPFLREFRVSAQVAEANALSTALAQIQNLETIKRQINSATDQWVVVQEQSGKTVQAAKEIADRMKAELKEFCSFLDRANETEKTHLRLEVEKHRRSEGEWVQVIVRILDHVYALHKAAAQSGQPGLVAELSHFQHACRDTARRIGLMPVVPTRRTFFDPKLHQLADGQSALPDSRILETLASGYTFRGQLIRKPLVTLGPEPQPELPLADGFEGHTTPPDRQPAAAPADGQPADVQTPEPSP